MIQADRLLDDEDLVNVVFQAQGQRHAHSSTLGRAQTPAETVLRLLLLKHVRNWSFNTLEHEVVAILTLASICLSMNLSATPAHAEKKVDLGGLGMSQHQKQG